MSLQRAQQLIQQKRGAEAVKILLPICRAEPDNLQAWELLAQAASEPRQIRYAWQQVLRIDPYHETAFIQLAELDDEPPPPVKRPTRNVKKSSSGAGSAIFLLLIMLILVILILGGVGLIVMLQGESNAANVAPTLRPTLDLVAEENELDMRPAASQVALLMSQTIETRAELPATWTPTFTPSVTFTFTPSPTFTPPATLPPTWTTSPTYTPITPTITFTPSPTRTRTPTATFPPTSPPRPTVNPSLFSQTYWGGDGDGETMDTHAQNGRYYRHFKFPINVYFDSNITPRWQQSITYAINLLSSVVPMRRTLNEDDANINVYVMTPDEYLAACPELPDSAGCGGFEMVINQLGERQFWGYVFIREDSPIDTSLTVHEMMHALGVHVHSPDPNDVMYFQYSTASDGLQLTARDRLILELLYSLPAIGE